jgi:hypothetical protein
VALVVFADCRRGEAWRGLERGARLAVWPVAALLLFVVNSRMTTGHWFVTGGFYVPDPLYETRLDRALVAVWWGVHQLSGYVVETLGICGALGLAAGALRDRHRVDRLIPLALLAAAALPVYAFFEGHPFRIRYMVPEVAACALFAGLAVGLLDRRPRSAVWGRVIPVLAATLLLVSAMWEAPPFRPSPMLAEARWDQPASEGRRQVTACLRAFAPGQKILASMGSLAHYMHELSTEGFDLVDFIHEGNGVIWEMALETGPAPHAAWMLVEEESEGGDVLARRLRSSGSFGRGMTRVCGGGGVALYRRDLYR